MLTFREDVRDVDTYLYLRKQVDWVELNEKQAERALKNSMKIITAYFDGKPLAWEE